MKKSNTTIPPVVKLKDNNKAIKSINKEVLNMNEHHVKNFINFDIKIEAKEKIKKKTITDTEKSKDNIPTVTSYIKELEILFRSSWEKCRSIQSELLQGKEPNIEMLQNEIKRLKIQNEFYDTKAKFYEKIFYTAKNCIETSQDNEVSQLKRKLESIMTQNNKYYYEELNLQTYTNDETNFKNNVIIQIEDKLITLLKELYRIEQGGNFLLSEIKEKISHSLKGVLSLYFLSRDYSFEFKNKSNFYLENEAHFYNLERKHRTNEILSDLKKFLEMPKNKKETFSKLETLINFYENSILILKTENISIKQDSSNYVSFIQNKINNILSLVDGYNFGLQLPLQQLREILLLVESNNLKNKDKIISTIFTNQKDNLLKLIQMHDDFINAYSLIK